jgi:hypothetical protein
MAGVTIHYPFVAVIPQLLAHLTQVDKGRLK